MEKDCCDCLVFESEYVCDDCKNGCNYITREQLQKLQQVYQLVQKFIEDYNIAYEEMVYYKAKDDAGYELLKQLVETVGYTQDETEVEE